MFVLGLQIEKQQQNTEREEQPKEKKKRLQVDKQQGNTEREEQPKEKKKREPKSYLSLQKTHEKKKQGKC
ncbi:hypothetical protein CEXT_805631 [Caerostris extrusa]|uniref:Uncharacterized protein n=1 Tax=Caerostris extrusa TaxID=172846 RepID=A0AAV4WE32_CAEEX|nr:hypothetical protein CEXT_805631 [Caerostris extrusa]